MGGILGKIKLLLRFCRAVSGPVALTGTCVVYECVVLFRNAIVTKLSEQSKPTSRSVRAAARAEKFVGSSKSRKTAKNKIPSLQTREIVSAAWEEWCVKR